jgi:hypothetical protein
MPRIPPLKRTAVFVRELKNGQPVFVRRPWDFVDIDQEGSGFRRFVQIFHGSAEVQVSDTKRNTVFDEMLVSSEPYPGDPAQRGSLI